MFIFQIVIVLIATKIAGHISVRLGQPSVLGKILIGIIIGPAMLDGTWRRVQIWWIVHYFADYRNCNQRKG